MRIGDGDDTASREMVARQEAEAVRRDATGQPAVTLGCLFLFSGIYFLGPKNRS